MWNKKQKSQQEVQLAKHSEVEIDKTSRKNACRKQCDWYIDSNISHHEPEDDVETESSKNNDNEEQQNWTQNNNNQKMAMTMRRKKKKNLAKKDKHDSDVEDKSLSSGSDGSSYQERAPKMDDEEDDEEELSQKRKHYLKQKVFIAKGFVDGSNSHDFHALSNRKSRNRENHTRMIPQELTGLKM